MASIGTKIELKSFNLTITLLVATVLAVVVSFGIYIFLIGLSWNDLNDPEIWSMMFTNLFATESLFFLIFFVTIIGVIVLIMSYNAFVSLLFQQQQCANQKMKWDRKKKSCV